MLNRRELLKISGQAAIVLPFLYKTKNTEKKGGKIEKLIYLTLESTMSHSIERGDLSIVESQHRLLLKYEQHEIIYRLKDVLNTAVICDISASQLFYPLVHIEDNKIRIHFYDWTLEATIIERIV